MVGRMSAGRCCCDEEPGGCLVFDDRDTDPGYSICAGSWTVAQAYGTYITESSNARLMFNDTISAGTKFRFYVSVTIEKITSPFVGNAVIKLFGAASGCTGGAELILTVNYTGALYDGGSVVLGDVDSDEVYSTETYDLELCYDGSKLTAAWYDAFGSRITTRTFTPSSNQFGFGTGTLESGMRITFTAPRLEKATGGLCPLCDPSCCAGPVPDEMIVKFTGWPSEWECYSSQELCALVEYEYWIHYDLTPLNAEITLTHTTTNDNNCVWEARVALPATRQFCIDNTPQIGTLPDGEAFIRAVSDGSNIALYIYLPNCSIGVNLIFFSLASTTTCELLCSYTEMEFISKPESLQTTPTAEMKTPCLGFAMPAKGYGIPKDPNTKPTPEPELPEDVRQWLMQLAPLSKTQSSSSELEPTKDVVAPN